MHRRTMYAPKVDDREYIQFLVAAQCVFTCTKAAVCQSERTDPLAQNASARLLVRQPSDATALRQMVAPLICRREGALSLDDSTLDKSCAKNMAR